LIEAFISSFITNPLSHLLALVVFAIIAAIGAAIQGSSSNIAQLNLWSNESLMVLELTESIPSYLSGKPNHPSPRTVVGILLSWVSSSHLELPRSV
jgi:hypothetical protein